MRRGRSAVFTISALAGVLLSSVSASAQPFGLHEDLVEPTSSLLDIDGPWRALAGDDLAWADPNFDDGDWLETPSWFEVPPPELGLDRMHQSLDRAIGLLETELSANGLRDTLMLVAHRAKHGIEMDEELADLPKIPCFPSQLNQVFLNLLVNAVQAIEGAGRVTVRSRVREGFVEVDIEDDGVGIAAENLDRIFDPGFTPKGVRVGTGLGLSISDQIVQEHHGRIDVRSRLGEGACFTVAIPTDLDARLGRRPEA